jgi:hypothetical protein
MKIGLDKIYNFECINRRKIRLYGSCIALCFNLKLVKHKKLKKKRDERNIYIEATAVVELFYLNSQCLNRGNSGIKN